MKPTPPTAPLRRKKQQTAAQQSPAILLRWMKRGIFFARLVAEEFDTLEADESIVFPEMSEEVAKRKAELEKEAMELFDNNPEARLWSHKNPDSSRIRELCSDGPGKYL